MSLGVMQVNWCRSAGSAEDSCTDAPPGEWVHCCTKKAAVPGRLATITIPIPITISYLLSLSPFSFFPAFQLLDQPFQPHKADRQSTYFPGEGPVDIGGNDHVRPFGVFTAEDPQVPN